MTETTPPVYFEHQVPRKENEIFSCPAKVVAWSVGRKVVGCGVVTQSMMQTVEGPHYFGSGAHTEAIPLADDYRVMWGTFLCISLSFWLKRNCLPWNGVRIDADSLCTAPFLTEEKKNIPWRAPCIHFSRCDTLVWGVSTKLFVQPERVQKLYRLFEFAALFFPSVLMQTLWLHVWLHRVGSFGNQSFVSAKL